MKKYSFQLIKKMAIFTVGFSMVFTQITGSVYAESELIYDGFEDTADLYEPMSEQSGAETYTEESEYAAFEYADNAQVESSGE